MKILVVAGEASSLINFRFDFLKELNHKGCEVHACAGNVSPDIIRKLQSINVVFHKIPYNRIGLNPFFELKVIFSILKVISKIKPHIVFSYTLKTVLLTITARYFYFSKRNQKGVSLITGLGFLFLATGLRGKLLRLIILPMLKFFFKKENVVFFQNKDDLILFRQLGLVSADKAYLVNGSGVNLNCFLEKETPPCDTLIFLLMARVLRDKGVFEYVEAARRLKKKYVNVIFQLMGPIDSNPSAISKEQISSWQSEGVIEYLGEQKDVKPFLEAAHVFVLPSYREGVPRSALEAMAIGRAIVSTDAPGCKETVAEGQNGFLVPVKNFVALADALEKFVLSPELVTRFGKESRRIVEEKFCVEKINARMLEVMRIP